MWARATGLGRIRMYVKRPPTPAPPSALSRFRPSPRTSIRLFPRTGVRPPAAIPPGLLGLPIPSERPSPQQQQLGLRHPPRSQPPAHLHPHRPGRRRGRQPRHRRDHLHSLCPGHPPPWTIRGAVTGSLSNLGLGRTYRQSSQSICSRPQRVYRLRRPEQYAGHLCHPPNPARRHGQPRHVQRLDPRYLPARHLRDKLHGVVLAQQRQIYSRGWQHLLANRGIE